MGYREDFAKAKVVSLFDYCKEYEPDKWSDEGYTLRHKDMSSLIVSKYTTAGKSLFFDNSCRYGVSYGDTIDYLKIFYGMSQKEATSYLANIYDIMGCDGAEYIDTAPRTPYILPEKSDDTNVIYDYLCRRRGIAKDIIDIAVDNGILYQSKRYANAIFASEKYEWSEVRGTGYKKYCSTLKGSEKIGYWGFAFDDDYIGKTAIICEGGIDALSCAQLVRAKYGLDYATRYVYVSTGGVAKRSALIQCKRDFDGHIIVSPDNDTAGDDNLKIIRSMQGFEDVMVTRPSIGKDWNECLHFMNIA